MTRHPLCECGHIWLDHPQSGGARACIVEGCGCRYYRAMRQMRTNPMVLQYGTTPDRTCSECTHLIRYGHYNRVIYKCNRRGDTRSAATDHRKTWPACGRYEPRGETWSA